MLISRYWNSADTCKFLRQGTPSKINILNLNNFRYYVVTSNCPVSNRHDSAGEQLVMYRLILNISYRVSVPQSQTRYRNQKISGGNKKNHIIVHFKALESSNQPTILQTNFFGFFFKDKATYYFMLENREKCCEVQISMYIYFNRVGETGASCKVRHVAKPLITCQWL